MLDTLINFFDHPVLILFGRVSSLLAIVVAVYTIFLVIKGVLPVWYRLGISLSRRKIAIFAEDDEFNNLKNILVDSRLFKERNIRQIDKKSIWCAESESLLLVYWKSYEDKLDKILTIKKDKTALVIYAPVEDGRVEESAMKKISEHRNSIVVNFRGRLINDLLVCMMTSSGK